MSTALRWAAVAVVLFMLAPTAVRAQPAAGEVYRDPAGRFSVPVPAGWTAEQQGAAVTLRDPDRAITIFALSVPAATVEQGLAEAWRQVDPSFDLPVQLTQREPSMAGIDQTLSLIYTTGSAERIVLANGRRVGDTVYAILADGRADAVSRRQSQLLIVLTGFTIAGVERVNLRGQAPAAVTPAAIAELEAYTTGLMERMRIPGAAVAIVQDGRTVYLNGFGVTEQGRTTPVTPDTLMMIGSITKTMTTLMLAQLVDEGVIDWDTPVVEILPTFAVADPEITRRLTVRNLVCACTGVPRRDYEMIFNAATLTAEDVVESLRSFQFFTEFGQVFQYSNQMVASAGYVAALADGGRYGDLYEAYARDLQRRVFDPIGMTRSTVGTDRARAFTDRATPHGANLANDLLPGSLADEATLDPIGPAGTVWSTARDMAAYLTMELQRGVAPSSRRVVSEANLAETWQPRVPVTAEQSYGLGWFTGEWKGLPLISHGGNTIGFTADLAFLPESGIGIVVLTNGRATNAFNQAVRTRLFEIVFDQPRETDTAVDLTLTELERLTREQLAKLRDLDVAAVEPYAGRYHSDALGELTITLAKGRLVGTTNEFSSELRQAVDDQGNTVYYSYAPPIAGVPLTFTTDEAGRPVIQLKTPTDTYTFRPVR
jgi:CubicO group peptidase (beta-lactamase class C family)